MTDAEKPKLVGSSRTPLMQIPAEAFGTTGAQITIHIVPQPEDEHRPDEAVFSDPTERTFIVSAKLSKSPLISGDIKGDFSERDGDCYLFAPSNTTGLRIDTDLGSYEIKKNAVGELSLAELKCNATNAQQARMKFIEIVYPSLDHLSYSYNVAIFVTMIRVVDVKHQSTHIECVGPYRRQVLAASLTTLFGELKPVYSVYRDAKNSASDFYKFLCFYKIMEGLLGPMRASLFARAKAARIKLKINRELVPHDRDLASDLKPYSGKPLKEFFDTVLAGKFRNAVAHFKTGDGILFVSSPADLYAYANLAFASDLCTRVVIATHEQLLAQLHT
jgi:hypothetical protein